MRDEELSKLSGIPGCIFVHAGGFIGGNETYEGVLEMARRTLQGKSKLDSWILDLLWHDKGENNKLKYMPVL